ncbi:S-adenosyl-L-methionine-dependent methyltransferase [Multifurca ochricompacta]|uniref:rRNA adenine N(6)-methyltransferase n=1 Tax=Multifurca ochricompacta TaxID=376703 RepID=A0AAD4QQV2_9AGAM|nr:S-adenosyl-L-methionine-dependent methyltransferase [Multifurca ochricompacta]
MLSLLLRDAHNPRVQLKYTRNVAFASNEVKRKRGRPPKSPLEPTPDVITTSTQAHPSEGGHSLALSLNHYFRLPPLPPVGDWLTHFPYAPPVVRDRISIRDPASAIQVAQSFVNSKKTSTGNPKIIIEAFPGPGALSRAFLTLPPSQLQKLIILEDHEPYLEYLRPLARADPRVRVVPLSGFNWDTYSHLLESGDLDVNIYPWEELHPELHFVTHIPQTIPGEQLVAQLFRCIPEKSWLFKYGRIPMSFILADWVWRRISAQPKGAERSTNTIRIGGSGLRPETRRRGSPFLAVNVVPHAQQVIDKGKLDQWDYILRRLFVLKSTPLRGAISSLAPGAEVLLDRLTDKKLPAVQRVDIRLMVKHLTISDWALIARAFDAWPFAPEDLNIDSFVAYERE